MTSTRSLSMGVSVLLWFLESTLSWVDSVSEQLFPTKEHISVEWLTANWKTNVSAQCMCTDNWQKTTGLPKFCFDWVIELENSPEIRLSINRSTRGGLSPWLSFGDEGYCWWAPATTSSPFHFKFTINIKEVFWKTL